MLYYFVLLDLYNKHFFRSNYHRKSIDCKIEFRLIFKNLHTIEFILKLNSTFKVKKNCEIKKRNPEN